MRQCGREVASRGLAVGDEVPRDRGAHVLADAVARAGRAQPVNDGRQQGLQMLHFSFLFF